MICFSLLFIFEISKMALNGFKFMADNDDETNPCSINVAQATFWSVLELAVATAVSAWAFISVKYLRATAAKR